MIFDFKRRKTELQTISNLRKCFIIFLIFLITAYGVFSIIDASNNSSVMRNSVIQAKELPIPSMYSTLYSDMKK